MSYILKAGWQLEIFFAILIYSCNAPRTNPLDPNNPDISFSVIQGNVSTSYIPITGIPGVLVFWEPGNKIVKTDADGNFIIESVRSVDGNLIFQKEGFKNDTVYVNWNGGKQVSKLVHLVSLPALYYLNITTSVEFELSGKTSLLGFDAKIENNGNLIDSAYIENQSISLKKKMNFLEGVYSLVLNQDDLGTNDLENLAGEDFNLFISDSALGTAYKIGSGRITRVIDNEPEAVSPANSDTVSSPPVVQWNQVSLGFSFNYLIEIYTNEALNNQLVYSSSPLESGTTSLDTQYPLPPGEYFWVIWISDQFNNRARSKPAIFVVQ
ncbi:MAG TPA: hypothetical protein VMT35_12030 [Ignavibacteriaceae bacterium]|nr:hypothetical protein [Ignavibacteriaceae bacterium]